MICNYNVLKRFDISLKRTKKLVFSQMNGKISTKSSKNLQAPSLWIYSKMNSSTMSFKDSTNIFKETMSQNIIVLVAWWIQSVKVTCENDFVYQDLCKVKKIY